jgi:hypothetical protein
MTVVHRFYSFWYDFLVGDSWELFVGPIVALLVVGTCLSFGVDHAVAGLLLFTLVVAVVLLSVARRAGSAT